MNVLVINCGSSSLKFSVVETQSGKDLAKGIFDRLGNENPTARLRDLVSNNEETPALPPQASHQEALDILAGFLRRSNNPALEIAAVGHRVVHGGERFTSAATIDDDSIEAIEAVSALAPLHNPSNLLGIKSSLSHFPNLPQVAVFDTAFHQTIEKEAYLYALPFDLYRKHGIRRYGFHGSSHKYVFQKAAKLLQKPPTQTSVITIHLGNGCSAAAVENGACVDTTMGLTPLEGLVMGTRSGDIDPGIIFHLHRELHMSVEDIDKLMNKQSGLLGLSEISNDMRELREAEKQGNAAAALALRVFERRLAKSVAALRAAMSNLDALIFTGGIGENDALTRANTLSRLAFLGLELDPVANANAGAETNGRITSRNSPLQAIVIPTNEELMIACETAQLIENTAK